MARKSSKQRREMRVSARQVRRTTRRAQLRVGLKKLEAKAVVSARGRTSVMEAAAPGQPVTPQTTLLLSTAIKRYKYNLRSRVLRIWFVNGGSYDYFDVPESIIYDLDRAPSKGRYFYYNIRTSFKFQKVS